MEYLLIGNEYRKNTFIHYGSKKLEKEKILPLENGHWIKPKKGGLWASPVDSSWGWKDWCKAEDFRDCLEENSFKFIIKDWAKIFIIDSLSVLKHKTPLTKDSLGQLRLIDFEEIQKHYDIIWLTEKGQQETHLSDPIDLYGWDCESLLVINPNCIEEI